MGARLMRARASTCRLLTRVHARLRKYAQPSTALPSMRYRLRPPLPWGVIIIRLPIQQDKLSILPWQRCTYPPDKSSARNLPTVRLPPRPSFLPVLLIPSAVNSIPLVRLDPLENTDAVVAPEGLRVYRVSFSRRGWRRVADCSNKKRCCLEYDTTSDSLFNARQMEFPSRATSRARDEMDSLA